MPLRYKRYAMSIVYNRAMPHAVMPEKEIIYRVDKHNPGCLEYGFKRQFANPVENALFVHERYWYFSVTTRVVNGKRHVDVKMDLPFYQRVSRLKRIYIDSSNLHTNHIIDRV